ncbi:SDR family NAD(P)-dependent oxidoreductase [Streptomyces sp. t39]|uniref:SDR family NAD(P)-dependent oxidoreductase n=1 Tax=Streptomyces sp. t39 TaxID=1828156 RepID=UPI001C9C54BF|nr:SDR family NAD(P)-dependent oxidoreductase [Streptomyces sp. t39]
MGPAEVGRSLVSTRALLDHRAVVVGEDRDELLAGLDALARDENSAQVFTAPPGRGRTAFLFSGQGSQRPGTGAELYRTYPVFAEALDTVCEQLDRHLDRPLREVMFAEPGSPEAALLDRTGYAQPAIFALQTALHTLVRSMGPAPDLLLGHSVGGIAAAHAAGVLDLPDACTLVAARARLMEAAPDDGAMAAVEADESEMRVCLGEFGDSVSVAAVNAPRSVVISGEDATVEKIAAYWEARGRRTTRLRVSHAFHSAMMNGVLDEFRAVARTLTYHPPAVPVVSELTGLPATGDDLRTPDYWVRHLRETVRFMDGARSLLAEGVHTFLELGPDATLTAFVEACAAAGTTTPPPTLAFSLHRDRPEARTLASALARIHVANIAVERPRIGHDGRTPEVDLPTYAFQGRRHWLEPGTARRTGDGRAGDAHPLLGARIELASGRESWFAGELTATSPWFVEGHVVADRTVLPGSAMLEWALAAVRPAGEPAPGGWTLRDVTFDAFLPLPADGGPVRVQAVAEGTSPTRRVRCLSRRPDGPAQWTEHATAGAAGPCDRPAPAAAPLPEPAAEMRELPTGRLYDAYRDIGLDYGSAYRALRRVWRDGDRAVARIEVPEAARDKDAYLLHPVVLDACFQTLIAFADDGALRVPVGVERLDVYAPLPPEVTCRARRRAAEGTADVLLDLDVLAPTGDVLAVVEGLRFRAVPRSVPDTAGAPAARTYAVTWRPAATEPGAPAASAAGQGDWIVCGTDRDALAAWCAQLAARGVRATAVHTAPGTDGPEDTAHAAFEGVRRTGGAVRGLILLTDADAGTASDDDAATDTAAHGTRDERVVAGAYRLARDTTAVLGTFLRTFAAQRPDIVLCTAGAAAPDGGSVSPARAVLTGLARAVVAEHPELTCVQVDLDAGAPAPAPAEILDRAAALAGSGHLAVRAGRWYEARLQDTGAAPALPPEEDAPGPLPVKPGATYLITGGLGGIGLAVAARLADRGADTLLLVGRTVPERTPAPVAALRERGVRVEMLAADVADETALDRVLAHVEAGLPPLHGVVHAAGVTDGALVEEADWDGLRRAMDPKVAGAWLLHRRTRGLDLGFFVLCSALGALTGLAGQPGYLMANSFLDALALHRRREGLPALSVGWGTWAGTGMAADRGLLGDLAALGLHGMTADEALDALDRVPAGGPGHVAVGAVDWARFAAAAGRTRPDTLLAELVPAGTGEVAGGGGGTAEDLARLVVERPEEAPGTVLGRLLDVVASVLGLSDAEREAMRPAFGHRHLNELGFDSLTTIRLRNRLRADFFADVPADFLFGGGTARGIAELICRQLAAMSVLAADDEEHDDAETEVLTL